MNVILEIPEISFEAARSQLKEQGVNERIIGLAADFCIRDAFYLHHESTTRFAPFDGYTPDMEFKYHEAKCMVSGKYVNFSPKEKEHAEEKLSEGFDTLIWLAKFIPPKSCQILAITRYSKVAHLIKRSNHEVLVERNGHFVYELGWFFHPESILNNREK